MPLKKAFVKLFENLVEDGRGEEKHAFLLKMHRFKQIFYLKNTTLDIIGIFVLK